MPERFLKWSYRMIAVAVLIALPARAPAQPPVRVLQPGDDLIWRIQTSQELLNGQSQIQCHVDEEGTIDLGRYGRIRVAGLTVNDAKLALETRVAGQAATNQTTNWVSELPTPLVATGFVPAAQCSESKNQAGSGVTTGAADVSMVNAPPVRTQVQPPTAKMSALAGVRPAGIDRMISEQARLQMSAPRSSFQRHREPETASTNLRASPRAEHFASTVSTISPATGDQQIIQAGTSSYHPLAAMPVRQASYSGPDPFPTDIQSPSDPAHTPQPQTASEPKSGWQRLCDTFKSIHFPRSTAADAP
jgi:hypothetical protein